MHQSDPDRSDGQGPPEQGNDFAQSIVSQSNSLQQAQARLRVDLTKSGGRPEENTARHTAAILSGLQCLSLPLANALAPLLGDEAFMEQVEEQYIKLTNNTQLQQETALDLLHALGSLQEAEEVDYDRNSTKHDGGDELLGLSSSGSGAAGQDEVPRPVALPAKGSTTP